MLSGNANTMLYGVRSIDTGYFGVNLAKQLEISFGNYANGRK